jgi:hypothetical protein
MAFRVRYVVPRPAGVLPLPADDEVIAFEQTVDPEDRIVELAIAAVGDGYQMTTDLDYTAPLRGSAAEAEATRSVDAWILELAPEAVRVHELLLDRWHEVASASHHTSIGAMTRWLAAHDPARDYWAPLGGRP